MTVQNNTSFEHGLAIGMGPDRRACVAVVVKGTFTMPPVLDGPVVLAEEQQPVVMADEYYQGDVTGSLRLENECVPFKPRADIVLVGKAYVPGGQRAKAVDVLLQVGRVRKALRVFGNRQWLFPSRAVMVPIISEPEPFSEMPLVYERAFGGIDRQGGRAYNRNYVGKGILGKKSRDAVHGKALPNIEDPTRLISSWDDEPAPVGYGFYSPCWQPRAAFGGTAAGLTQPHPFFGLAADFRHDYYNGAHPDLQVSGYLRGDEGVDLINLTRDGRRRFRLPGMRPAVTVHPAGGEAQAAPAPRRLDVVLDTLVFLPDDGVFCLIWRGRYDLPGPDPDLSGIAGIHIADGKGA